MLPKVLILLYGAAALSICCACCSAPEEYKYLDEGGPERGLLVSKGLRSRPRWDKEEEECLTAGRIGMRGGGGGVTFRELCV